MNHSKILVGLSILVIFGITLAQSLKCYGCYSEESCKKASQHLCNPGMANATRTHLNKYHFNVNVDETSPEYECFREEINSTLSGKIYYKGCIYATTKGACTLPFNTTAVQGNVDHKCYQCNDKNGCNPAGRAELHYGLTIIVALFAILGKFVCST